MSLHRRVGAQTDGCAQPSIITTRASRAPNDATHRRRARRALLFLIHPRVAPRVPSSVHPPGTSRRRDSDAVASSPSRRRRAPAPSRRSAVPAREDRRRPTPKKHETKRNETNLGGSLGDERRGGDGASGGGRNGERHRRACARCVVTSATRQGPCRGRSIAGTPF